MPGMELRSGRGAPLPPVGDGLGVVVEKLVMDGVPAPSQRRLPRAFADLAPERGVRHGPSQEIRERRGAAGRRHQRIHLSLIHI